MDDLTAEFVNETRETLALVSEALIAWEANPSDTGRLDEIFRFVHTVKGSCGFLDLPRIGRLAHEAETVLVQLRSGERAGTPATVSAMLAIVDRIGLLAQALESGGEALPEATDNDVLDRLDEGTQTGADEPVSNRASSVRTVRVSIQLLDLMMTQISELVLARNAAGRVMREADASPTVLGALDRVSTSIGELRDSITRTRTQPIDRLFSALPRLVRTTAADTGKEVKLVLEGADVEIDREMVELIRDPLTHVIRNAIDHGIEPPEYRIAAGKTRYGLLRVVARQSGNQVSIEIQDDGRGIDVARLIARAIAAKLVDPVNAERLAPDAALDFIFAPGLSTASEVNAISGRGIGMDVARANVEKLGGSIALVNRPGHGLSVTLCAPLTLSIISVLLVEVGGLRFAMPRTCVHEIVSSDAGFVRIERLGEGFIALVRGQLLTLVPLGNLLCLDSPAKPMRLVIVDAPGGQRYALGVDAVQDHEEVVVRPIAPQLSALGIYSGQALPDSGVPTLLLDACGVAIRAGLTGGRSHAVTGASRPTIIPSRTVLVFTGLDGVRGAFLTDHIERIEDIDTSAFASARGQDFASVDNTLYPARLTGTLPESGFVQVIRLRTVKGETIVPVAALHDLVPLGAISPVEDPFVEGFMMHDGRAVEIHRANPSPTLRGKRRTG